MLVASEFTGGLILRFSIFGKLLSLAAGLAVIGSSAFADTIYECSFLENRANNGWVPTSVVVSHVPGAEKALVSDAMILSAFGEPRLMEVKRDTETKLTIEWEIGLRASDGTGATFSYVLVIQKQAKTATINGFPEGYSNQFGSTGTCKVKTE